MYLLAPLFLALAILSLLFKLPGVSEFILGVPCLNCSSLTPYIPMLAAAYFSFLLAVVLVFPDKITKNVAKGGLFFALGLAFSLTYISYDFCTVCLVAHFFHILAWIVLLLYPAPKGVSNLEMLGLKLLLVIMLPLTMTALFSTLNFTFLVYGLSHDNPLASLSKRGQIIKPFQLLAESKAKYQWPLDAGSPIQTLVLTFTGQNCPYCRLQLPKLDKLARDYQDQGVVVIHLGKKLSNEEISLAPHSEWVEDSKGELAALLGVSGFPTTIVIDKEGKVLEVIAGAAEDSISKIESSFITAK